jgi:uncharacterized protein
MESGLQPEVAKPPKAASASALGPTQKPGVTRRAPEKTDRVEWFFIGSHGLRAGWSILLFAAVFYGFRLFIGTFLFTAGLVGERGADSASAMLAGELAAFLALAGALAFSGLVEGRSILAYNLDGPHRVRNLISGVATGFAALSLLVGALAWGGWLRFGASTYSPVQAVRLAALWGCAFLIVGSVEEGLFRCYGLFTLERGINFWWALAAQIAICLYLLLDGGGHGAYGVYAAAALGVFPCLMVHLRNLAQSSFWQAAWVTSTLFGAYHTANGGENWAGILAAAAIGFVFCVGVRVTGSAWWAIGCHAAWDWAETFFYGTANSGLRGEGHLLTAIPAGKPIWSGGADGPEGSLLALGVIVLLVLFLLFAYGRSKLRADHPPPTNLTEG